MSIPDEGHSRNAPSEINSISTLLSCQHISVELLIYQLLPVHDISYILNNFINHGVG